MLIEFGDTYRGLSVLLTGHTGFKGSWLSLWLARLGAKVTGLSVDIPTVPSLFDLASVADVVDHKFGDVRDRALVESLIRELQPQIVFHLAAQPLVRRSYQEPVETLETNVMGTAHVLEAVRASGHRCDVVVVTSDKCYNNDGRIEGYRETDPLGGHDPYSMSKGGAELVVESWRSSYFSSPDTLVRVASGRAGNVIGGGDWAQDRIVTDCIAALIAGEPIGIRNPLATRPWQHVLEPISGYLWLGQLLRSGKPVAEGWNFGPRQDNIRNVQQLADELVKNWRSGATTPLYDAGAPKEAIALSLNIEKAETKINWQPVWDFERTVKETVAWYRGWADGERSPRILAEQQIEAYVRDAIDARTGWSTATAG